MEEKERWAVNVGGTRFPGYNSAQDAQNAIDQKPEWKNGGAVASRLVPEKTVRENLAGILGRYGRTN